MDQGRPDRAFARLRPPPSPSFWGTKNHWSLLESDATLVRKGRDRLARKAPAPASTSAATSQVLRFAQNDGERTRPLYPRLSPKNPRKMQW